MDYIDNRDCIVIKYIYRDYRRLYYIVLLNIEINFIF